jgi:hypothetical protein
MRAYAHQDPISKTWEMRGKRGTGRDGTRFCGFNPSSCESIARACSYVGATRMTDQICKQMRESGYTAQ